MTRRCSITCITSVTVFASVAVVMAYGLMDNSDDGEAWVAHDFAPACVPMCDTCNALLTEVSFGMSTVSTEAPSLEWLSGSDLPLSKGLFFAARVQLLKAFLWSALATVGLGDAPRPSDAQRDAAAQRLQRLSEEATTLTDADALTQWSLHGAAFAVSADAVTVSTQLVSDATRRVWSQYVWPARNDDSRLMTTGRNVDWQGKRPRRDVAVAEVLVSMLGSVATASADNDWSSPTPFALELVHLVSLWRYVRCVPPPLPPTLTEPSDDATEQLWRKHVFRATLRLVSATMCKDRGFCGDHRDDGGCFSQVFRDPEATTRMTPLHMRQAADDALSSMWRRIKAVTQND